MTSDWKTKLQKSDFEQLLGEEIDSYKIGWFLGEADNYGSITVAPTVTLKSGKVMKIAVKLFPQSKKTQTAFNSPVSMKKEIDMYMLVFPEFQKIQEEHSVPNSQRLNTFCKCLGARSTLHGYDPNQLADENAILLLDNLRCQGYRIVNRVTGQDLKHAEMVMIGLAKFHATAIAIKIKKPGVFKSKIMKACKAFKLRLSTKEKDQIRGKKFIESLKSIPVCERNMDCIIPFVESYVEYLHSERYRIPKEPFATIVHDDLWTNNLMFKYKSKTDKIPLDFKVNDYQVVRYGSPVSDVIFYLFSSTETGIVTQYLDHLLKLYHNNFVDWLKILGCETDMFKFKDFLNELDLFAPLELAHILYWLLPIKTHNEQLEEFVQDFHLNRKPKLNEDFIQKASETVKVFLRKSWL